MPQTKISINTSNKEQIKLHSIKKMKKWIKFYTIYVHVHMCILKKRKGGKKRFQISKIINAIILPWI